MIAYPEIDPAALHIFGWPLHWYGLMYLFAFAAAFALGRRTLRRAAFADLRPLAMEDMLLAAMVGVIVGGRLGYVLFYDPALYAGDPLLAFKLWKGGMSFHGGLLGVIAAMFCMRARNAFRFCA